MNEKFCISIRISLKYVPRGPIDNKPALIQAMARHWIGDKPLPEPMLTQSTEAYMQLRVGKAYWMELPLDEITTSDHQM